MAEEVVGAEEAVGAVGAVGADPLLYKVQKDQTGAEAEEVVDLLSLDGDLLAVVVVEAEEVVVVEADHHYHYINKWFPFWRKRDQP